MTTTVTALKSSTAIAAAAKATLAFSTELPPVATIRQQAATAFADNRKGGELLGSAQQRMAYAVMCEVASMVKNDGFNMALADCLSVPDTATTIRERMLDFFLGDKDDTSDASDEAKARVDQDYTAKRALVVRSIKIAAIFDARGVTFGMFNVKLGVFACWPSLLYPVGTTPMGRLAKDDTIMLDGRPIVFLGKNKKGEDKTTPAKASVAHMLSICAPMPVKRAGKNAAGDKSKVSSGATFNLRKIADVAAHIQLPILIGAVHAIMVKDAPAEPMRKADMPDAVWNALTAIMQAYDKARNAPTWSATAPVKVSKRKPADEAATRRSA